MNSSAINTAFDPPAVAQETAAPVKALSRRDDLFYEELSRTNNDLVNLQRELARKNAELAAAQKKLEVSEQRYRSLSACSPIGILEMDTAGRCLYTNPHWGAITGLTAEESLGDGWQRALDGLDAPALLEGWTRSRRTDEEFDREFRFVTSRGENRWAHLRSQAILAERGEVAGYACTIEDITGRKQAEAALAKAHTELVDVSRQAGMAEVATSVLHNVGNVLNSVNVSATVVSDTIRKSERASLTKVVALLNEHEADLGAFLSTNAKGKQVVAFLGTLAGHLAIEQTAALQELKVLQQNIDHIKDVVSMQQSYATFSGVTETLKVVDLIEDTLRMHGESLAKHDVTVVREFSDVPDVAVDKHKLMQILVNLVRNAKQSCDEAKPSEKRLTLRVANGSGRVKISVSDNGVGIPPENLTRIFNHGFTTKKNGHGFGLHSGANAAKEMGGALLVHSEGAGRGATFTVELPVQPLT